MRKNRVINVLKLGFLYLSTVIGAGFATGREIRVYFTDYGVLGYVGLGISTILLILAGCAILKIVHDYEVKSVSEFNERIGGFYLGKVLDFVVSSFSYCLYVIVLAGLADILKSNYGIEKILTVLTVTVISIMVHILGFNALAHICSWSAVLIALMVLFVSLSTIKPADSFEQTISIPMSLLSSVLYVGYNILMAVSVMSRALPLMDGKAGLVIGSLIGSIAVMACALVVNISLHMSYGKIKYSDMPLLTLVELYMGKWGYILFLVMLVLTMSTSAISGLSSVLHIAGGKMGLVLVALSIPLSFIGFGTLMDIAYPVYGAFGIMVLFILVLSVGMNYNKVRDDQCDRQKNRYKLRTTKKKKHAAKARSYNISHTGRCNSDSNVCHRCI